MQDRHQHSHTDGYLHLCPAWKCCLLCQHSFFTCKKCFSLLEGSEGYSSYKIPLQKPPIPVGHILVVYGSDELSSVPPWSVRLGPVEMAVTVTFLFGDLPFFHLVGDWDWALLQRIILWQWVGEISLCWDIKHIQTKVWKIEMTRLLGCCFLSLVKCSDVGSKVLSGLLLWTQVSLPVYSVFPGWRCHMIILEVHMPPTNAVSSTYLILVSDLTVV